MPPLRGSGFTGYRFPTKIPLLRSFVIREIFYLTPARSKGEGDL